MTPLKGLTTRNAPKGAHDGDAPKGAHYIDQGTD
jgi:hypothetical protein